MAITSTAIDLEWTAATDNIAVTRYEVEKSTDGITFDAGINVGNVLTYTYVTLSSGTQYWFRISAFDAASNESNYSEVATATTLGGFDYTLNTVI